MIKENHQKKLSPTQKKIASNIYWAILGKIINMLSVLFVGILVARYLGPDQYGLMNYVISYVTIFNIIATFGLDNIEIRELSKFPNQTNEILGTTFKIRLTFATIAFLLIINLLFIFHTDRYTALMIITYSITLYLTSFNVIRNYFTSIIQNEYIVKTEIIRTFIGAIIKILLLYFKAPLFLFIVATAFEMVLVSSGYIYSYQKKIGKISEWKFCKATVSYYIKESFPLVLSGTALIIYQRIDQVMIKNMIDNKSVGYFATAGKFVDLVLFLPTVIAQTITPLLIRIKKENLTIYIKKRQQFMDIMVWVSIILSLFVSSISYWIILYTFGQEYLPAVPILQIMIWKTVGMSLSASSGQIMIIEGTQKWSIFRNIIGMIICIGFNLLFIPQYGIIGSAWVTIFTVLSSGFLAHILIPPYHQILKMQVRSLVLGWKSVYNIRNITR